MFFLPADRVESPAVVSLSESFETSSISVSGIHSSSSVSVETSGDPKASGTPLSDDLKLQSQSNSSPGDMVGGVSGRSPDVAASLIPDEELGCDRLAMEFLRRKVQMLKWKETEEAVGSGATLSQRTTPTTTPTITPTGTNIRISEIN